MSSWFKSALPGVLALLSLAAPAGASALPVTVNVRVEGATRTIFDGPVVTDGHNLNPPASGGAHPCDGTNNGAFPAAGPTATAALDDAARAGGFSWDGSWDTNFSDFLVNRVGPESATTTQFWGHFVNGKEATAGGCQTRLKAGDETVWAFDAFSKTAILRLQVPTTASIGTPVSFRVTDTRPAVTVPAAGGPSTEPQPARTESPGSRSRPRGSSASRRTARTPCGRTASGSASIRPTPCRELDRYQRPRAQLRRGRGQRGGLASTTGRSRTMLISWAGDDRSGSGIKHYSVEVAKVGEDGRRKLLDKSTVNGLHFRGDAGAAYRFRITGTDRALNATSVESEPVIVPVDDRNRGLWRFSKRGWKRIKKADAWGRTVMRARSAGAKARYRSRAPACRWWAAAAQGRPAARDPRRQRRTLRLRGRSALRTVLWNREGLDAGGHRLVLAPWVAGRWRSTRWRRRRDPRRTLPALSTAGRPDRRGVRGRRSEGRADGRLPRRQGGDQNGGGAAGPGEGRPAPLCGRRGNGARSAGAQPHRQAAAEGLRLLFTPPP